MTYGHSTFLDAWLWRQGIEHPVILPLVRNEFLLTALFLLSGVALFTFTPWVFWFGVGIGVMALTFWSLARFFLRKGIPAYTSVLLLSALWRWSVRLFIVGALLYVSLIVFKAPPSAILGGLTAGVVTAFVSFAFTRQKM